MYRNPRTVRELEAKLKIIRKECSELADKMYQEKALIPVGYELIGAGDIVKEGALAFEPGDKHWYKTGNSVGCMLNDQGYVSDITYRG